MSAIVPIVTVNASVVEAPAPNGLQQTGVLITQGGTTGAVDTLTPVGSLSAVEALLAPAKTTASVTWSGNTTTVTTVAAHGWNTGDVVPVVVAGVVPGGFNGSQLGNVTGASTVTYPLSPNPGNVTVQGTINLGAVTELKQMATTYFAGVGVPGVNVLELGEGNVTAGVALLSSFIGNVTGTPEQQYGYLVPREWDNNAAFMALAAANSGVSSMLYFWVTTTQANRALYSGPGWKAVYAEVEAPTVAATEFSLASAFGTAMRANPSSTNKVPPLSYAPSFGTTAYPLRSNQSVFQQLANASVGWIGTGQQGGISSNIIFQGKMSDGNFWNFWYSIDWAQINMNLSISNEVINGSASSVNPLYYNQAGINRLQNRAVQTASQGVASGLGNGQVVATQFPISQFLQNYNAGLYNGQIVINAEPFLPYSQENPSDYGIGRYAGLACIWIPQNPFLNIIFTLQATSLITGG